MYLTLTAPRGAVPLIRRGYKRFLRDPCRHSHTVYRITLPRAAKQCHLYPWTSRSFPRGLRALSLNLPGSTKFLDKTASISSLAGTIDKRQISFVYRPVDGRETRDKFANNVYHNLQENVGSLTFSAFSFCRCQ